MHFQLINKVLPIRMSEHEELLGADFTEHDIRVSGVGVSRAVSVLRNVELDYDGIDLDLEKRQDVGENHCSTIRSRHTIRHRNRPNGTRARRNPL